MTAAQIVNWIALAFTSGVVVWRGRRPEWLGMSVVALAFLATPLVERRDSWYQPQSGILAVDAVTLALLAVIAFRYDRYWPILAVAVQAITVLTSFAFLINPEALYRAYYYGNFSIGFLLLGSILGGVAIESSTPFQVRRFAPPRSAGDP